MGDIQTASDSHSFLLKWFQLYPEFLLNPFYIAGESYAGVYVPILAYEVVKGIDADTKPTLNFKGYLLGNGVTDEEFDGNALVPFAYGMGLVSDDLYEDVGHAWPLRAPVRDGIVPTWPQLLNSLSVPCTDDEVATSWLNDASVRKAIHAEDVSTIGSWELCTDKIIYYHGAGRMIKYHKNITSSGFKALIFSGDHDMGVPYTGSQAWTRSVGYKIVDEWRPWFSNEQVAGFLQGNENNLTFLTIKGAGHPVPKYKPQEALDFYSRFPAGKPI